MFTVLFQHWFKVMSLLTENPFLDTRNIAFYNIGKLTQWLAFLISRKTIRSLVFHSGSPYGAFLNFFYIHLQHVPMTRSLSVGIFSCLWVAVLLLTVHRRNFPSGKIVETTSYQSRFAVSTTCLWFCAQSGLTLYSIIRLLERPDKLTLYAVGMFLSFTVFVLLYCFFFYLLFKVFKPSLNGRPQFIFSNEKSGAKEHSNLKKKSFLIC